MTRKRVIVYMAAFLVVTWSGVLLAQGKPPAGVFLFALISGGSLALGLWIGFAAVGDPSIHDDGPATVSQSDAMKQARRSLIACCVAAGAIGLVCVKNMLSNDSRHFVMGLGQFIIFVPTVIVIGLRKYRNARKAQTTSPSQPMT